VLLRKTTKGAHTMAEAELQSSELRGDQLQEQGL